MKTLHATVHLLLSCNTFCLFVVVSKVPREEDAGAGATEEEEGGEVIGMEFPQGALNPLTYTGGSQDTFYIPPSTFADPPFGILP